MAHGTTSLVFRATQERLNRTVAIKLLLGEGMDTGGTSAASIARELETMVRLSAQPHIVSIIDTGRTAEGRHYTVMEYCEDGSYAQILQSRGPLPVDDVVEVGLAIGEALHAAHQAGIIHRDVKPSNILRSRFGPALADFGIARAPDELAGTLTREMMTPHHASPRRCCTRPSRPRPMCTVSRRRCGRCSSATRRWSTRPTPTWTCTPSATRSCTTRCRPCPATTCPPG
ncbi:serine/threonine-protein kinase [Luedemannella flava]